MNLEKLQEMMNAREGESLECKEAKNNYDFEKLVKYCVALANEGGGYFILGVTDKPPRQVVGSNAFINIERTKAGLIDRLRLRIDVSELSHPKGRVLIFQIPSRPIGMPIHYNGAYWMRAGENLIPMTTDKLKRIFDEAGPDFSSEICRQASIEDLDMGAIKEFRKRWWEKSGNDSLLNMQKEQLLTDSELLIDGKISYAALILLGNDKALGRHLPQAEVIFEYRHHESSGPPHRRVEFRKGYFLFHNELWNQIDIHNDTQHFHDGLFVRDIMTFNAIAIREAIQNAIAHRDYRFAGSIFIRQYPRRIEIVSPGGFPAGISLENILWRQSPRNRRIAEILARCGMVERSGQGMNLMFESCIRESKPRPDFSGTDNYQVSIILNGTVQDPKFIKFLEQVGQERLSSFNTIDFLLLDAINREVPIIAELKGRIPFLIDQGIIERIGRGKGTKYILSRRFYSYLGSRGTYTRKRGLDRQTNKELLLRHLSDIKSKGCQLSELRQVLPELSYEQVKNLLRDLKNEGLVFCVGKTRAGRWFITGSN